MCLDVVLIRLSGGGRGYVVCNVSRMKVPMREIFKREVRICTVDVGVESQTSSQREPCGACRVFMRKDKSNAGFADCGVLADSRY